MPGLGYHRRVFLTQAEAAMPGPDTEFNHVCRKVGDVVEVLPGSLSDKARKEVNDLCGKLAQKAKTKSEDLDHLFRGEFGKLSEETKKELAELVRDIAKDHTAAPVGPTYDFQLKPINLEGLTKGKGERLQLGLPFKFTSGTDVYLFLNYDKDLLLKGTPQLYGGGAGFEQKFDFAKDAKLKGEILLDTSQGGVKPAGFIKLEWKFGGP